MAKNTQKTKRQLKDTVLIVTNGETEYNYFEILRHRDIYSSIYKIELQRQNKGGALELIKFAVGHTKNKNCYNKIWVVCDIDDASEDKIKQSKELACKSKIELACSYECFEVWLLYHFYDIINNKYTRDGSNSYTKKLMQGLRKQTGAGDNIKYTKVNPQILEKYFIPQINDACHNAKVRWQLNNNDGNISNISNVYELIEFLQLENATNNNKG